MNKLYDGSTLLATDAVWSDVQAGWLVNGGAQALCDPQRNYTLKIVPTKVTPRQAKLALAAAGLYDAVTAMIAASPASVQITWENAIEFLREDPLIAQLAGPDGLDLTEEQIDDLFIAAGAVA